MKNKYIYLFIAVFSCVMSWKVGEFAGQNRSKNRSRIVLDTPKQAKAILDTINPKRIKKIEFKMSNVVLYANPSRR